MSFLDWLFGAPAVPPETPAAPAAPVAPVEPVVPPAPPPAPAVDALGVAADLAIPFEGFSAVPYPDPGTGNQPWTIGYGSTRDARGLPVTRTTPPVTRDQARSLMARDMRSALAAVQTDVHTPLNSVEEGALADLVYNIGAANFRSSTMLRKLNAGDLAGAAAEFDKWNRAGGRVLAGLVRRRAAERAEFLKSVG